jgi:hypothetical protein
VSGQPTHTTQFIEHQAMAKGLKLLFDALWLQGEDYDDYIKKENPR